MATTLNRVIEVSLGSDPTAALSGVTMSIYNGYLNAAQNIRMNAGVVGTATVMQSGDTIDLDNNGSYESVYGSRFNFASSTYKLADGSTISGAVNFIKVTTAGVAHYYLIIPDTIAAALDAGNIVGIIPNGAMTTSPNTAGDNFNDATKYQLTCFASDTRILTQRGEVEIGKIKVGDMVWTRENWFQPVRWVGRRQVLGQGAFAPIEFAPGVIGNERRLRVSPQHRIYVSAPEVELLFSVPDAFVAACNLVGKPGVRVAECGAIDYMHLMFDRHEIILAEGVMTESFFPGSMALGAQDMPLHVEIRQIFPDLDLLQSNFTETACYCLNSKEAKLIKLDWLKGAMDFAETAAA